MYLTRVRVDGLENTLEGFEIHLGDLLGELEGADADNVLTGSHFGSELDLPFGLCLFGT